MQNSLHQIFANVKFQAFSLHVIFTFWEPTHSGDHASLLCLKIAWVVAKLWWYKIWSVESLFIRSRQKSIISYTCILWDVITRGVINSVCSPLVIYTLKLYKTILYVSPSLQPMKLSTWFLHYWNEENLSIFTIWNFCKFVLALPKCKNLM